MKASNKQRIIRAIILGLVYSAIYYFIRNFLLSALFNFAKINWYGTLLFGMLLAFAFEFINPKLEAFIKRKFGGK